MENSRSHGSLGQRLFGTKQKKLAWGGAGALAVSVIVIVVFVLSSKPDKQGEVGVQTDSKGASHTLTGQSRPRARKSKVNPDGTPKPDTSKTSESSSSTSEEEEGEHKSDTANLGGKDKKAKVRTDNIKLKLSKRSQQKVNNDSKERDKPAIPLQSKEVIVDGSNPNVQPAEKLLLDALDKLKFEGKLTVSVPQKISDLTPEKITEYLKELKVNGREEDSKGLMEKYTKANAGDAKKTKAVAKIVASQSAIEEAINFIKSDSKLNLDSHSKVPEVLKKIEKATTIEQLLDFINTGIEAELFSSDPTRVLLKAFSCYLQAKGENETVLNALRTLQNSLDIKSNMRSPKEKLQQANAWAEVLLNIKDEIDLTTFSESAGKNGANYQLDHYSCYPYSVFNNQKHIEILRIFTKEQTESLTKSKNFKEFLHNLSHIDLSHSPCKFEDYVRALSYLYGSNYFSDGLYSLANLGYYCGDNPLLFNELLRKRLERVAHKLTDGWKGVPDALRNFAKCFEEEGDVKEADEWREYALEADLMFSIGLPKEEKYRSVFDLYKTYKMVSKETLSPLLKEFATLEPLYRERSKYLLISITKSPIYIGRLLFRYFYSNTFSADKTAQNIIKSDALRDFSQINNKKHLCYQFPLLVGVLDDDIVNKFCEDSKHPFIIPANLGFKGSEEFKEFVTAQKAFLEKFEYSYDVDNYELKKLFQEKLEKVVAPDFAPNISFLDLRIYQNVKEEGGALIEAYEKLAGIMATYDSAISEKMKEHIKKMKEECFKLGS